MSNQCWEYNITAIPHFDGEMQAAIEIIKSFILEAQYKVLRKNFVGVSSSDSDYPPVKWQQVLDEIAEGTLDVATVRSIHQPQYLHQVIETIWEKMVKKEEKMKKHEKEHDNLKKQIESFKRGKRFLLAELSDLRVAPQENAISKAFLCKMLAETLMRYPDDELVEKLLIHHFSHTPTTLLKLLRNPEVKPFFPEGKSQISPHSVVTDRTLLMQLKLSLAMGLCGMTLRAHDRVGRMLYQEIPLECVEEKKSGKCVVVMMMMSTCTLSNED